MIQNSYNDTPSLYLIPTPIGNLDDMTYRAVKVLEEVEVIFSEDTRVTLNLLNNFGIKKKLISLHEHNEDILKEKVLEYLKNGYSVGLVTDRGTPIISDPGYKTVKYISDNNYNVIALPGATAFVCALIASGISPQPFLFYGFLNSKDSKRRDELEMLKDNEYTMIFYEAPHKLIYTLNDMRKVFGNRNIALVRELTKIHEQVLHFTFDEAIAYYADKSPKGEYVIIIEGKKQDEAEEITLEQAIALAKSLVEKGMSINNAAKEAAAQTPFKKGDIYKALI